MKFFLTGLMVITITLIRWYPLVRIKPFKMVAQMLKGEASFWFNNKSGFDCKKLEWQKEYFAVSVSESGLRAVRAYIDNRAIHYRRVKFEEEYQEFIRKFGFQIFG